MLLTILAVFTGYFVGKGKRGTRMWKMLGIVLAMAFFLTIIASVIVQLKSMILPVGTNEIYEILFIPLSRVISMTFPTSDIIYLIVSLSLTFFWFLVGKWTKWLTSKRGL